MGSRDMAPAMCSCQRPRTVYLTGRPTPAVGLLASAGTADGTLGGLVGDDPALPELPR